MQSKGFIKEGKNNKLRASDIKRIADTFIKRESVTKFSRSSVVKKSAAMIITWTFLAMLILEAAEHWDVLRHVWRYPDSRNWRDERIPDGVPALKKALFTESGILCECVYPWY